MPMRYELGTGYEGGEAVLIGKTTANFVGKLQF